MPKIVVKGRSDMGAFEVWPAGTMNFEITKVEQSTAKSSGTPQLVLSTKVLDGTYADKTTKMWFSHSPNAIFRMKELLEAVIPGEYDLIALEEKDPEGHPQEQLGFDTDALVDRRFTADCSINKKESGEERNEFKKYRPYGEVAEGASEQTSEESAAGAATEPPAAATPRARTRQVTT